MTTPARSLMLDEIHQQPAMLELTLNAALISAKSLRAHFRSHRPGSVLLVARGSSDNAALFGRYLIEITTGIPGALAAPSVYTAYNVFPKLENTLVVGISQSGESTDINAFLERARATGAITVGITNEPDSAMTRIANFALPVAAGRERSVAATKSYTGQLMALYVLAQALGGAIEDDSLRAVCEAAGKALQSEDQILGLAEQYQATDRAVCIGRGLNYGSALEWSLKLMETCQVVAQPFSAADFLHGPIAMLGASFPAFVFAPPGPTGPSVEKIVERLFDVRAKVVLAGDAAWSRYSDAALIPIAAPACAAVPDLYTPIPYIVPAQLFAAHLASVKNLDADRPRGLTKVTKTM
jgi:glutamine---fructose-6-phosphate transaminase (isomerizing)